MALHLLRELRVEPGAQRALETYCRITLDKRGADWHVRRALFAAEFGVACAPADAAPWQTLLCARYLVLFFVADDVSADELRAFVAAARAGRATTDTDLGALYRSLCEELTRRGLETVEVETTFLPVCAAMTQALTVDLSALTYADYHRLRPGDVATAPYIACWKAVYGVTLSAEASRLVEEHDLARRAIQATYLVNDLASIEHEVGPITATVPPLSLNYVLLHTRESADLAVSIRATIEFHNRHVEELGASMREVLRAGPEPGLVRLIAILRAIVDGGLDGHIRLTGSRYRGGAERLSHLSRLGTLDGT